MIDAVPHYEIHTSRTLQTCNLTCTDQLKHEEKSDVCGSNDNNTCHILEIPRNGQFLYNS